MPDFPLPVSALNDTTPVPRRVRGTKAGSTLVDSTRAIYVWEWPYYPHYYFPNADVDMDAFVEGNDTKTPQGEARRLTLKSGAVEHWPAARLMTKSHIPGLTETVRVEWNALDV